MQNGCFFAGALCGGRMSGDCNYDIGVEEVKAVLADDTGTLLEPFLLFTHDLHKDQIFNLYFSV
jgi:hypothetical protein